MNAPKGWMLGRTPDVFVWDDFRLDLDRYRLERAGAVLALEPKALDLLALLVGQPGHLFSKQEIFETLWPDTAVTDHALTRVVAQLRRVLADEARDPRFIETVPTRGYRWKCPVRVEAREDATVWESIAGDRVHARPSRGTLERTAQGQSEPRSRQWRPGPATPNRVARRRRRLALSAGRRWRSRWWPSCWWPPVRGSTRGSSAGRTWSRPMPRRLACRGPFR